MCWHVLERVLQSLISPADARDYGDSCLSRIFYVARRAVDRALWLPHLIDDSTTTTVAAAILIGFSSSGCGVADGLCVILRYSKYRHLLLVLPFYTKWLQSWVLERLKELRVCGSLRLGQESMVVGGTKGIDLSNLERIKLPATLSTL